nr:methionine--trna ligase, chloroplastic/mitochondrial [Quercus suber]
MQRAEEKEREAKRGIEDAFAMMASGFVAIVEIESALPSLARPIMSLDANEDVVVDALKQSLEFGQPKACIEAKKKQPSNSDIQSSLKQELDMSYYKFIGTIDPKYEAIVKECYSWVLANGDIHWADYEGLLSIVRSIRYKAGSKVA